MLDLSSAHACCVVGISVKNWRQNKLVIAVSIGLVVIPILMFSTLDNLLGEK